MAACLHEIGVAVSYRHHHRHAGYLIRRADLPGFSRNRQRLLVAVVGNHRREVDPEAFDSLPAGAGITARRLVVLRRLAISFHRARGPDPIAPPRLRAENSLLSVLVEDGFLAAQPLPHMDLEAEAACVKPLGIELRLGAGAAR